jgi:hypothetical protein
MMFDASGGLLEKEEKIHCNVRDSADENNNQSQTFDAQSYTPQFWPNEISVVVAIYISLSFLISRISMTRTVHHQRPTHEWMLHLRGGQTPIHAGIIQGLGEHLISRKTSSSSFHSINMVGMIQNRNGGFMIVGVEHVVFV